MKAAMQISLHHRKTAETGYSPFRLILTRLEWELLIKRVLTRRMLPYISFRYQLQAGATGGRKCKAIMEFRTLGPIELWSAGQQCDLGPARARRVLAILLLTPRTIVPAEALIDRLWDTQPPPKARESLSVYIAGSEPRSGLPSATACSWRAAPGATCSTSILRRSTCISSAGCAGRRKRWPPAATTIMRPRCCARRTGSGGARRWPGVPRRLGGADARQSRGGAPGGNPGARRVRA